MMRRLFLLLCLLLGVAAAQAAEMTPLVVETAGGPRRFQVEIADTPDAITRGLMFRESLPATGGMLFQFSDLRPRAFWMRNTLIPLDIIFIDGAGIIRRIHPNARPLDLTSIPSGGPAAAVLEINGGHARLAGIREGDRVRHAFFGDAVGE